MHYIPRQASTILVRFLKHLGKTPREVLDDSPLLPGAMIQTRNANSCTSSWNGPNPDRGYREPVSAEPDRALSPVSWIQSPALVLGKGGRGGEQSSNVRLLRSSTTISEVRLARVHVNSYLKFVRIPITEAPELLFHSLVCARSGKMVAVEKNER